MKLELNLLVSSPAEWKDPKILCFNIHALLHPNPVLRLQTHCQCSHWKRLTETVCFFDLLPQWLDFAYRVKLLLLLYVGMQRAELDWPCPNNDLEWKPCVFLPWNTETLPLTCSQGGLQCSFSEKDLISFERASKFLCSNLHSSSRVLLTISSLINFSLWSLKGRRPATIS